MYVAVRPADTSYGPSVMQPDVVEPTDLAQEPDPVAAREAWSGFADVYELPASGEAESGADEPDANPVPADPAEHVDETLLAQVVLRLAAALDDERGRRAAADEEAHRAGVEVARLTAELAAERAHVAKLEQERDEVICRAEELLSAVRERGDRRLAAELDASKRHWSELLAAERQRVEVLDGERARLLKRLEDAWTAIDPPSVRRRSRPSRPRTPPKGEVVKDVEATAKADAAVEQPADGESAEIDQLRQRLRSRLHKVAEMDDVEDGVDRLRESRLAREKESRRRR
jgi:hypothetical protein